MISYIYIHTYNYHFYYYLTAIFECIRGVQLLGDQFSLPTCPSFFNIFHPYDPIAYRYVQIYLYMFDFFVVVE